MLSCRYRVEHDGYISTSGVLHSDGNAQTAGGETVLLVFHRASTHGNVGQQVGQIAVVFGIQHLVRAGKTVIGNNVFVGMNAIILMGTKIGSNVIVGAGAVVSGNIPDNVVVAGNPARVVRTIEEHYEIRKSRCLKEAVEFANCFKDASGRWPTAKELNPFFPLFLERTEDALKENGISLMLGGDDEEEVLSGFLETSPTFSGYEEFIAYCEGEGHA